MGEGQGDSMMILEKAKKSVRAILAEWLPPPPPVQSPYKDSTQIGISAYLQFRPSDVSAAGFEGRFEKIDAPAKMLSLSAGTNDDLKALLDAGWRLTTICPTHPWRPVFGGYTRVYKSFKPTKAVLSEQVCATYGGNGLPAKEIIESVPDAADVVLLSAFSGADNCFPYAPSLDYHTGIAGPTFAPTSLGNGISWPTLNGGIDMSVSFGLERSVLCRARGVLPPGYDETPRHITVTIRLNLLGPSLR